MLLATWSLAGWRRPCDWELAGPGQVGRAGTVLPSLHGLTGRAAASPSFAVLRAVASAHWASELCSPRPVLPVAVTVVVEQ